MRSARRDVSINDSAALHLRACAAAPPAALRLSASSACFNKRKAWRGVMASAKSTAAAALARRLKWRRRIELMRQATCALGMWHGISAEEQRADKMGRYLSGRSGGHQRIATVLTPLPHTAHTFAPHLHTHTLTGAVLNLHTCLYLPTHAAAAFSLRIIREHADVALRTSFSSPCVRLLLRLHRVRCAWIGTVFWAISWRSLARQQRRRGIKVGSRTGWHPYQRAASYRYRGATRVLRTRAASFLRHHAKSLSNNFMRRLASARSHAVASDRSAGPW